MAMIFITHDLGVVAEICDDVAVMYGGKIVEQADVFELFDHPKHDYTKRLLSLMPSLDKPAKQMIEIKPMTDIAFI
jgi:peptide/nickel transport system ATP-binding protein